MKTHDGRGRDSLRLTLFAVALAGQVVAASHASALVRDGEGFDPRRIPIELQSWWIPNFGHIHAGTRLPLGQSVSGTLEFDVRVVLHNNPSHLSELRIDDDDGVRLRIPLDHECPYDGSTGSSCAFNVPVALDTTKLRDGWRELRIRAQTDTPDDNRYLNSSGIPIHVDNGGSPSDYDRWCENRSLIGRGWYDEFGYTNAVIECVPLEPVSGVHTFWVRAQKDSERLTVALDKTHAIPAVGPWGPQAMLPGSILFDGEGDFQDWVPVEIDTATLADGWHTLAVTSRSPETGTSECSYCSGELNRSAGVAKIWFYARNGTEAPPPTSEDDEPDGGEPDGGEPDGGEPDGGEPDGGEPDGGEPDGGEPDGGEPDGGEPDGDTPGDGESDPEPPGGVPGMETVTLEVGDEHRTVELAGAYVSPVVVCSASYANNHLPVVVRVSAVTENGFDVRLQNPGDDVVEAEQVSCLVVEEGVWTVDGHRFEAVRYVSGVTDDNDRWDAETQGYGHDYAEPVVVGQVMSENNPRWSVFWARGTDRKSPPSPGVLATGKTVCEDDELHREPETIGFIVFDAAHGSIAGVEFEAAVGRDRVRGAVQRAPYIYRFDAPFDVEPSVAVVSLAGMDGRNGGWAQLHGSPATTTDMLLLSVDEDQVGDAERRHTNEQVGYVVFAEPFVLLPSGE